MRPIDADELRDFLIRAGRLLKAQDDKRAAAHAVGKIIEHIDNMPTVDAEPVRHGHWIGTGDGYADGELVYDMWECSCCGYDADGADQKPTWNYCPNCGAKMDEEEK